MPFNLRSRSLENTPRRFQFKFIHLIALFTLGLLLIFSTIYLNQSLHTKPGWNKTQGIITDYRLLSTSRNGRISYKPTVKYRVEGKDYYVIPSWSSNDKPEIGSTKIVAYNPSNPVEARVVGKLGFFWYAVAGLGLALIIVSPYSYYKSRKRDSIIKSLINTGTSTKGVVTELCEEVSGDNTYYSVIVSASDPTGTVRSYRSDKFTGSSDIKLIDLKQTPIVVDVILDSSDPEKYYVDISDLPTITTDRLNTIINNAVQTSQITNPEAQTQAQFRQDQNQHHVTEQSLTNPYKTDTPPSPTDPNNEASPGWAANE